MENLILALAASKMDIFLMGCGKLPLQFLPWDREQRCPAAFQRGKEQEQSVVRRKEQSLRPAQALGWEQGSLCRAGGTELRQSPCPWGEQSQTPVFVM